MTNPAIRVEHLGKRYQIGGPQLRYKTIRDSLVNLTKNVFKRSVNSSDNQIWALKDVSFIINPGEVVGVIGRNGAGKSTLLKVLAHITGPTEGKVEIHGRIGSLLEVGTGFHPELTGRENIYLNGAVLGMKRNEIIRKFDEIVDFAEIEKFLDTPVKHYSSGMYMRLAFAVAAHLEPEILLVDEVLAVGDAEFQKKCLGKMGEVAKEGRTVLFVSHNMTAIQNLCTRTFHLHSGQIVSDGETEKVINNYLDLTKSEDMPQISDRKDRTGDGRLRFTNFEILTQDKKLMTGKPVIFRLHYQLGADVQSCKNVAFSFSINQLSGGHMLVFFTEETRSSIDLITKDGYIDCVIPDFPLASGSYNINLYATVNGILADYLLNAAITSVDDSSFYIDGGSRHPDHPLYVCRHQWIENGNPTLFQR